MFARGSPVRGFERGGVDQHTFLVKGRGERPIEARTPILGSAALARTPSPGPRRLVKTPSRSTLSPKGERGEFFDERLLAGPPDLARPWSRKLVLATNMESGENSCGRVRDFYRDISSLPEFPEVGE